MSRISYCIVILLFASIILAGCIAPPEEGKNQSQNQSEEDTGLLTKVPTYAEGTPKPTPISHGDLPESTPTQPEYLEIFNKSLHFRSNATAYAYDLTSPPMYIEFSVYPVMVTRDIWVDTRITDDGEKTYHVTRISPNAWFEVKVRDRSTGEIEGEEGFARTFSTTLDKELVIRKAGSYQIDFRGNDVDVDVRILVGNNTIAT